MKTALFSLSRGACCVQNDNPLKENALFASDFTFKLIENGQQLCPKQFRGKQSQGKSNI